MKTHYLIPFFVLLMIHIGNSMKCYQYNSLGAVVITCDGVCAIISYTDSPILSGSCVTEEYCSLLNLGEKGMGDKRIISNMRCHACYTDLCNDDLSILRSASSVKHAVIVYFLALIVMIANI